MSQQEVQYTCAASVSSPNVQVNKKGEIKRKRTVKKKKVNKKKKPIIKRIPKKTPPREPLVDNFEQLMNLFPTEHPAGIHGIMKICDQNVEQAKNMLQFVSRCREMNPQQPSNELQTPRKYSMQQFIEMRKSQLREDQLYEHQLRENQRQEQQANTYEPPVVEMANNGNNCVHDIVNNNNDYDNDIEENGDIDIENNNNLLNNDLDSFIDDFIRMIPNIDETVVFNQEESSPFLVVPPAKKFSELANSDGFDFMKIMYDLNL